MIGNEELQAVMRVMRAGKLSEYVGNWSDKFYGGTEIQALEKEWAEHFRVKHAIAINSASSGLWAACGAVGLKPEDEVIVTPYSMTISATAPLHFGAEPVFADIERDYFCLDPKSVEERITDKTKAIIAVDLFGQPADFDAINDIARRYSKKYGHKIYVIEDASQAPGAKYKGKYTGTLGDIGVFSLNFHKHIQCGEGGIVVTNDDDLAMRIRLLANHAEAVTNGMDDRSYDGLIGMNLRMTELQAAIAREQLHKLDGIVKIYQENARNFPVKIRYGCTHAFYRYAFIENDLIEQSYYFDDKFNYKKHYIKPIYKMPLFRHLGYIQDLCPVCEEIDEKIILAWSKEII